MQRNHSFYLISVSVLLCMSLISCSATKVKQSVLMPANSNEMKTVKKLAVVGFTGDEDNKFSTRMESFFSTIRVESKPYFTVVDRATLVSIMQKQNTPAAAPQQATTDAQQAASPSGENTTGSENQGLILSFNDPMTILGALLSSEPDSDTAKKEKRGFSRDDAIQMAKVSGADTIITGSVQGPGVSNTPYKEERDVCVEQSGKKCTKYEKTKVDCIKQQGKINFVMKAVDVNSGAITFSKSYSSTADNSYCKADKYGEKSADELAKTALESAIAKTRNDVAPYIAIVTIELMDEDNSGLAKNEKAKMLLDTGIKYADKGQMRMACDQFQLALNNYAQSPALLHNLGVCAEIKSSLDEAYNLYTQARDLSEKPNAVINTALVRVNERKAKDEQVESQLR